MKRIYCAHCEKYVKPEDIDDHMAEHRRHWKFLRRVMKAKQNKLKKEGNEE
jgi:hypothetical protein